MGGRRVSEWSIAKDRDAARERARLARSTPEGRERVNRLKRENYAADPEKVLQQPSRAPDTRRDSYLRTTYGISVEAYDALLAEQGGGCAVCGSTDPQNAGRCGHFLHVDHDHKSGEVRGLLCGPCNWALGQVGDSVDTLMALAAYLLRTQDVLQLGHSAQGGSS